MAPCGISDIFPGVLPGGGVVGVGGCGWPVDTWRRRRTITVRPASLAAAELGIPDIFWEGRGGAAWTMATTFEVVNDWYKGSDTDGVPTMFTYCGNACIKTPK